MSPQRYHHLRLGARNLNQWGKAMNMKMFTLQKYHHSSTGIGRWEMNNTKMSRTSNSIMGNRVAGRTKERKRKIKIISRFRKRSNKRNTPIIFQGSSSSHSLLRQAGQHCLRREVVKISREIQWCKAIGLISVRKHHLATLMSRLPKNMGRLY